MKIHLKGKLRDDISSKDIILYIIGKVGMAGGTGYVVEFCIDDIKKLCMEERMTICNMAIELGAKSGLIAPDEVTFSYLKGREYAPKGEKWEEALKYWKSLKSDDEAIFDKVITLNAENIAPQITWGTNPSQVISIDESIPSPSTFSDENQKSSAIKALEYMGLKGGESWEDIKIDKVFIGSCTNGRLEDLKAAARIFKGRKVAKGVEVLIVPGSGWVKQEAQKLGLDKIFIQAGCKWREPGCSMCLAMNDDRLSPFERCASTSNRNFEGRQGREGRTHLVSPAMAACAAISGHFVDVRKIKEL